MRLSSFYDKLSLDDFKFYWMKMKGTDTKSVSEGLNNESGFNYDAHVELLKKNCRVGYQLVLAIIASSTLFVNGLMIGHTAGIARKIKTKEQLPFPATEEDVTTITNVSAWGMLLGPIIFTYLINHLGRKKTLFIMFLPLIVHFMIIYFAKSSSQIIFASFVGYVQILMGVSMVSIYISEISSPHLRGVLSIVTAMVFFPGYLVGTIATWVCPLSVTSMSFFITTLIVALLLFYLPESPYFLIRNNQNTQAKNVLKKLYNQEEVSNIEYNRLNRHINESIKNPSNIFKIYSQKKYWVPIFLLMNLFLLLTFGGPMIFMWYSPIWLSDAKYRYLSPFICQMVLTILPLPLSLINSVIFKYVKRKTIGLISYSLNAFSLFSMAVFYYLKDNDSPFLDNFPDLFPFVILVIFRISLDIGLGNLPYIYLRELIQVEVLAYSSFIVDMLAPIGKTLAVFIFNSLKSHYSYSASFGFYFAWVVMGALLFLRFTPETKDRVMENIQQEMEELFSVKKSKNSSMAVEFKA